MKALVYTFEESKWKSRVLCDDSFLYFRVLHPNVRPCIVYKVCSHSVYRYVMNTIARHWCRSVKLQQIVCDQCSYPITDVLVHSVHECVATSVLRTSFICDIHVFGTQFLADLLFLDGTFFFLRLLGAPILPVLNEEENIVFLKRSFKYIHDCVKSSL